MTADPAALRGPSTSAAAPPPTQAAPQAASQSATTTPVPKRAQPKTTIIDASWGDFVPSPVVAQAPPPPIEEEVTAARSRSALLDMPVDDLDGDTNVLTGQDVGKFPLPPPAAAPAPVAVAAAAAAPVAAAAAAPAPVPAPAPVAAKPAAPVSTAKPTPTAAPSAPGRVASVVAIRVAVVGREGDLRLVPLAPGASPPAGAAVALLVPNSDADAAAIAKLVGL